MTNLRAPRFIEFVVRSMDVPMSARESARVKRNNPTTALTKLLNSLRSIDALQPGVSSCSRASIIPSPSRRGKSSSCAASRDEAATATSVVGRFADYDAAQQDRRGSGRQYRSANHLALLVLDHLSRRMGGGQVVVLGGANRACDVEAGVDLRLRGLRRRHQT